MFTALMIIWLIGVIVSYIVLQSIEPSENREAIAKADFMASVIWFITIPALLLIKAFEK